MLSDIEIAQRKVPLSITDVADSLGIPRDDLIVYGHDKAKIELRALTSDPACAAKLVLVTAINPTPAGEGKTTCAIGLADAFRRLQQKSAVVLREPSLGPVFGVKGGATGGGYAQVIPMEDINLHFTGDFHAIGAANNLLAALVDNHVHQGNKLGIDPRQIVWRRCVDMNDRQLRHIVCGLGGLSDGVLREEGFEITAASEVMAIVCLAASVADLHARLGRIVVGYTYDHQPVTASQLKAEGAMATLLKDAIKPNLVQTLEGTPAFVHGGPFANSAHGCSSVTATALACHYSDIVVTEAGFGADLGAEKFCDIMCRSSNMRPHAAVIVATLRALKYNGGAQKDDLHIENLDALRRGMPNLVRHFSNMHDVFGLPCVVALNRFPTDTQAELDVFKDECARQGITTCYSEAWSKGGAGSIELATEVMRLLEEPHEFQYAYPDKTPVCDAITTIAQKIYRADGVHFASQAERQRAALAEYGWEKLPVCIAKTPYSFTDDPKRLGAPNNFHIYVRNLKISAGAGFVVAVTSTVLSMPGLPRRPAAENINLTDTGNVCGLF